MKMTTLFELCTKEELHEFKRKSWIAVDILQDVTTLSWKELSDIGLLLMAKDPEYVDAKGIMIYQGPIAAGAINILIKRAFKENLDIF